LDAEETEQYIQQRLLTGGISPSTPLFCDQTVAAVYHYSEGLPRLINTICDNALVTAYARRLPSVTPDVIEDIAKEFRLDVVSSPKDEAQRISELDARWVTSLLLDLYASMRKPLTSNPDVQPIYRD
jgi:general secretion pathway protein A